MKTKKLIQISIPQQGAAPLVLCFSNISTFFKYVEENNLISEIDNKPKTFYNLLGNLFHIKGEVLQMIVMMIASVFIDAISPIALWIYKKKL